MIVFLYYNIILKVMGKLDTYASERNEIIKQLMAKLTSDLSSEKLELLRDLVDRMVGFASVNAYCNRFGKRSITVNAFNTMFNDTVFQAGIIKDPETQYERIAIRSMEILKH